MTTERQYQSQLGGLGSLDLIPAVQRLFDGCDGLFGTVQSNIRNEEAVEFGYKKRNAKAFEKRSVEPWHLACVSIHGRGRGRFSASSGTAFKSGKAKTPRSSELS
jgi:hypothetical protein